MIQNHINIVRELATHLAFDEAGLIPDGDMITLLASIPRLYQVFLTGDQHQLPAHHAYVPDRLLQYGFEGTLQTLHRRKAVTSLKLTKSYRAHPFLTKCLSVASYHGEVQPMLTANDRSLLTSSTIRLPVQTAPLVLLDIPGNTITSGVSKSNPVQEEIACRIHNQLSQRIPAATTSILSFYTGTKDAIKKQLQGSHCDISTVDGFQGK